jgi:hypothetical protein
LAKAFVAEELSPIQNPDAPVRFEKYGLAAHHASRAEALSRDKRRETPRSRRRTLDIY